MPLDPHPEPPAIELAGYVGVNRTVDIEMDGEMTMSGGTCTGVCHSENHPGEDWD